MNTFAGMQSFPAAYSTLSATALQQFITTCYNLENHSDIVFLKRGFNDTYLLTTRSKKYILRVYKHQWRNLENIETELELLFFLKKNGISVSVPIPDIENNYIQSIEAPEGERHAVLFSFAEGMQIKKLTVDQACLLGEECGNIHVYTKDLKIGPTAQEYDVAGQFERALRVLQPVLINHPQQFNFLLELQQLFIQAWEHADKEGLTKGICHGDLQAENFHLTKENQFTFFDFDFFGTGYLIYDIAVFMWYDHKNKPPEIMNAFLKGYENKRRLSATEHRLIPWLSTLRAIFQMTMYCELNDGKQLPLWPPQQIAEFMNKVEKWQKEKCRA